jgi:hypothetical protein
MPPGVATIITGAPLALASSASRSGGPETSGSAAAVSAVGSAAGRAGAEHAARIKRTAMRCMDVLYHDESTRDTGGDSQRPVAGRRHRRRTIQVSFEEVPI